MKTLIIIILVLFVFVMVLRRFAGSEAEEKEVVSLPYYKKQYLLRPEEKDFFHILQKVVGSTYEIFPQVHIDALVRIEKETWSSRRRYGYQSKINKKSVDFLLCEKNNLIPVLVIELDGKSHDAPNRKERDSFVDALFSKVGLPILHVERRESYDLPLLEKDIKEKISPKK